MAIKLEGVFKRVSDLTQTLQLTHFISGREESRVVLKRLLDKFTEAVEQSEKLLHILLRVLKTENIT